MILGRAARAAWKRRPVQSAVALLVLLGSAYLWSLFSDIPGRVALTGHAAAPVAQTSERMTVQGVSIADAPSSLLRFNPNEGDVVGLTASQAALSGPLAHTGRLQYSALEDPAPARNNDCRTTIDVKPAAPGGIVSLVLYQTEDAGDSPFREVTVEVPNRDLAISVLTAAAAGHPPGRSCANRLAVGGWAITVPDAMPLSFTVPAGASLRFQFSARDPRRLRWRGRAGFFQPFSWSVDAASLTVANPAASGTLLQEVTLNPVPWLRRLPGEPPGPLTFDQLEIGPSSLKIRARGEAWVQTNGGWASVNWLEKVKNNPFLGALLAALTTAILVWCGRLLHISLADEKKPEPSGTPLISP